MRAIGIIGAILFVLGSCVNIGPGGYDLLPYFVMALGVTCMAAWGISNG